MLNPLLPIDESEDDADERGVDPFHDGLRHGKTIKPVHDGLNPAANLIRAKIAHLYEQEPGAKQELREAKAAAPHLSKHQQFMLHLSTSGKSLAEIQTAWHKYYAELPDKEKHEVWQEFYEANGRAKQSEVIEPERQQSTPEPNRGAEKTAVVDRALEYEEMPGRHVVVGEHEPPASQHKPAKHADRRSVAEIKKQLKRRVSAGASTMRSGSGSKLTRKHHVQSLLFGLGVGSLVIVILLFSFFNDYIIAPFIQPSRTVSATPLIIGSGSVAPTSTPEVIIPKINVEIPLAGFDLTTPDENQIENSLEDGVVHYPTTVLPGQQGNTAFFGHSSNNIFNPGHYKFAFALLHDLVPGDTFYLTYGDKVYAYQVFNKEIVDPGNVSVLNNVPGKVATATLITCDPPGTSLHRLVVWGVQVSPNPNTNATGDNTSSSITANTQLPSNGPSLWDRLVGGVTGLF
ncbi:MAG TPA: class E sortase [Candidatus Saccharimonadales bacterium]|jgi:LPXTG-site transpeptidase (sortase) family protein